MIIDISRPLDEETAVFPGDVPFSREMTLQIANGDSCNVSCVGGSSHAGTHVDLPFHFSGDTSNPTLDVFWGPARVVASNLDMQLPFRKRVLFRTRNSEMPTNVFDARFECISRRQIEWLIENGAILVGVDAPSVDPADNKSLENHHALHNAGIAILENLDLSQAPPGEYELAALPLKIPGADATWVRAALRRL